MGKGNNKGHHYGGVRIRPKPPLGRSRPNGVLAEDCRPLWKRSASAINSLSNDEFVECINMLIWSYATPMMALEHATVIYSIYSSYTEKESRKIGKYSSQIGYFQIS